MAAFRIHEDQENNAPGFTNKFKETNITQKRAVLGVLNKNGESKSNVEGHKPFKSNQRDGLQFNENKGNKNKLGVQKAKNKTQSNVASETAPVVEHTFKEFKIFQETVKEEKLSKVNVEVGVKNEFKGRVLRDRTADFCKPSSSKEVDIHGCITALHKIPAVPVQLSLQKQEPMSETEDSYQGSPMCLDKSLIDSSTKVTPEGRTPLLTANERLYSCVEYRDSIVRYLRHLETERRPRKNYMLKQPDISYSMRAILVDWLVEVVEEYHMTNETLYLAVSYIDRFLSFMSVVRAKLQLVGTAAMFIASKFEEIYPPSVKDFVYITDDTYTKKQVLRMEHLILKVLSFDLSSPTALGFIYIFINSYPMSDQIKYLAMYLCELTLLEADPYLGYLPSEIAVSALYVARSKLLKDEEPFSQAFQEAVDYHMEDLEDCIAALQKTFENAEKNPQQAIREKYKAERYMSVSLLSPPDSESKEKKST